MSQHYSDPSRENDPHALPDIEVFYMSAAEIASLASDTGAEDDSEWLWFTTPGWYWWPCFPGCLPDSDPSGPFKSEADALADMRERS